MVVIGLYALVSMWRCQKRSAKFKMVTHDPLCQFSGVLANADNTADDPDIWITRCWHKWQKDEFEMGKI
jgi:hypothetical protein